jgi:polyisoprenyl-teichoic acid--peptidoglycan teichoic acid transferase
VNLFGQTGRVGGKATRVATAALAGLLLTSLAMFGVRQFRARPADASTSVVEIHSAHGSSFVPALQGKRPLFILALGSDARPGQRVDTQRSDSIHIIGVDTVHHRATILGFPRDSYVPIPGFGTDKINTAMTMGGPPLTVRTIESLTGIRIDFWALTSFTGMISMVNGIGGLLVYIPQALHDVNSGAFMSRGPHRLNGGGALAFARDRHDFSSGDLNRSYNQGSILISALRRLHGVFAAHPSDLLAWITLAWHNIRSDLSPQTLLQLALTATQIPVKNVNNLIVPATTGNVGAASVVFILPSAQRIYADMRSNGIVGR